MPVVPHIDNSLPSVTLHYCFSVQHFLFIQELILVIAYFRLKPVRLVRFNVIQLGNFLFVFPSIIIIPMSNEEKYATIKREYKDIVFIDLFTSWASHISIMQLFLSVLKFYYFHNVMRYFAI